MALTWDDRAHFIVGGEYQNSEDIGICSQVRDWCKSQYGLFTNTLYAGAPASPPVPAIPPNGQPHYIIGPNATLANQSLTGVLTPCDVPAPASASRSDPSGTSIPAEPRRHPSIPASTPMAQVSLGSVKAPGPPGSVPMTAPHCEPSVKRYTGLADVEFKINDDLNAFLQVSYARSLAINPVANGAIGPIALEVARGVFVPLEQLPSRPTTPICPPNFSPEEPTHCRPGRSARWATT